MLKAAAGTLVAVLAAVVPTGVLGELVSIGALLAFIIVCASVLLLRHRHPELPRPFKAPWAPFVPLAGIAVSLIIMAPLPWTTWLRLAAWLALGMMIYWICGRYPSRLQQRLPTVELPTNAERIHEGRAKPLRTLRALWLRGNV